MESSSRKHNIFSHRAVGAASHGGGSVRRRCQRQCWHPKLLVTEPGRLPVSATVADAEIESSLMREIIRPEVVFRIDDGLVRWERRLVFGGFNKRRPAVFMTVMACRETKGFLLRVREGKRRAELLRLVLAPAASGVADDVADCNRRRPIGRGWCCVCVTGIFPLVASFGRQTLGHQARMREMGYTSTVLHLWKIIKLKKKGFDSNKKASILFGIPVWRSANPDFVVTVFVSIPELVKAKTDMRYPFGLQRISNIRQQIITTIEGLSSFFCTSETKSPLLLISTTINIELRHNWISFLYHLQPSTKHNTTLRHTQNTTTLTQSIMKHSERKKERRVDFHVKVGGVGVQLYRDNH
ncbi:hypothetical protein V8G54_023311 [Vigna mungo]|uniref:Uncharacterized protein n=1 Tax=Vigna mungo TaxID=3915 RepID=A0AAQ3N2X5_VIGMU